MSLSCLFNLLSNICIFSHIYYLIYLVLILMDRTENYINKNNK